MNGYHRRSAQAEARPVVYEGMRTPWGDADNVKVVAPGIGWASTPSHGGVKLSPAMNRRMPDYMRRRGGWYEEDCDWSLPYVALADALRAAEEDEKVFADALETLRTWHPDAYERHTGEEILEGASYVKDRRIFQDRHANDMVAISAVNSADRPGFVEVTAAVGGDRDFSKARRFLVPEGDYAARTQHGFVLDPGKYEEIGRPEWYQRAHEPAPPRGAGRVGGQGPTAARRAAFSHRDDALLDGLSFGDLIDAVYSNESVVDEASVRKTFGEIVQTQMQDAEHELAGSMGQIIAEARG